MGLAIEKDVECGANLNGYLSTRILDPDDSDPLLNDWGIYHLHLGAISQPLGLVSRTSELLFAYLTRDEFFCVALGSHGRWANRDLVEIIHRDCPELIASFRLTGIMGPRDPIPDVDRQKLRRSGITPLLELTDGTLYWAPGGGITTAKTSTRATVAWQSWRRYFLEAEQFIAEISPKIDSASWGNWIDPSVLHLRLRFWAGMPHAVDDRWNVTVRLPDRR